MTHPPAWLHALSIVSLALAMVCALIVVGDIMSGRRQRMWIMNVVWPLTVLWSGPIGVYGYWRIGRRSVTSSSGHAPNQSKPFWQEVALAATHCGSGCTLGDIVAESLVVFVPVSLFGRAIFGAWAVDFVFAFALGIVFQYFTIAPMRGLGLRMGLIAALKADTASLSAWQVGMYGLMALAMFVWFAPGALSKSSPEFWFMMQLAMFAGFAVSYPVNWWLLRRGIKEEM